MQLENIATPQPSAAPQQRYATLHRAVERGLASDEVWYDLAQVCLQLGHDEEALRTWRMMGEGAAKYRLESLLARRGLIDPPVRRSRRGPVQDHALASPASGTTGLEPEPQPRLVDHLHDALHFLMQERMPLLVLVSMLAFPLVIGLGGFLTAGGSPLLLPAIAALPGLCVLGIVGALGRRVLVDAARGEEAPPALPELGSLTQQATRYLSDTTLIVVAMLGPSILMFAFKAPWISAAPGLVLGGFFLPMALALRQVRDDWRALSFKFLVTAIGRTANRYVGITIAFWAMFLPAAALIVATTGMKVWLQIAAVGPFLVLPVFTTARMLGTFLDAQRVALGALLGEGARRRQPVEPAVASAAPSAKAASARPAPAGPKARPGLRQAAPARPAMPKPPAGIQRQVEANRQPAARPAPPPPAAPRQTARPAPARPASTPPAPAASRPAPARRQAPPRQAAPPARPQPQARPTASRPAPARPPQPPTPPPADLDLPEGLSGFTIVTGADRERLGASARRN